MKVIGQVHSLWRYPVKSMRGEELQESFLGFSGVYGDRVYAFRSSGAPKGFPYLTGREQETMLLYRPGYRHSEHMVRPPNLAEAEIRGPGVTPVYASPADSMLDVETPAGELLAIDDPQLLHKLRQGIRETYELTLLRSDRAMTDCRPISLFSIQTVQQLSRELENDLDRRRFRANIYVDLVSANGFGEDQFVGRTLKIGSKAIIAITDRDPRCKMITLDADTAEANPEIMRRLARAHDSKAGVYGAVLMEGTVRPGDQITLLS
jgi:uncharacterized protein YcbX